MYARRSFDFSELYLRATKPRGKDGSATTEEDGSSGRCILPPHSSHSTIVALRLQDSRGLDMIHTPVFELSR